MAIWQPSEGESPRFGVSRGDVWKRGQGSPVLASMPRPANALARQAFQQWTNRVPWQSRWLTLEADLQTEWEAFAGVNLWQGLTGQPKPVSGAEFFAGYWSNATLFTGSEPSPPWEVPDAPTWTAGHQPFEPFLDPGSAMAIVTKGTLADAATFFFAIQPPVPGKVKLTRATCRPLGTFELAAGAGGRLWSEPMAAAIATYGPTILRQEFQQWLLAWQVQGGFCEAVLDPCWSPPPDGCQLSYYVDLSVWGYGVVPMTKDAFGRGWTGTVEISPGVEATITSSAVEPTGESEWLLNYNYPGGTVDLGYSTAVAGEGPMEARACPGGGYLSGFTMY